MNVIKWLVFVSLSLTSLGAAASLTQQQVQNYLASYHEVQAFAEQYPLPQKGIDRHRPLTSSVALLAKDSSHYQGLNRIVNTHHFANPQQWAEVGDSVMNAYFIIEQGASLSAIETEYQAAIERINSNPDYTEQHKKGVLLGMEKGYLRNVKKIQDAEADLPIVLELKDEVALLYKD